MMLNTILHTTLMKLVVNSSVEYYYQQSGGSIQLDPDGNVCIAIDDDYRKWKNGEILKSVDKTGLITSYTYPKPYDDTLALPIAKTVTPQTVTCLNIPSIAMTQPEM